MAGCNATGNGGWKSRADLRRTGSTGGRIVLDFFNRSITGALIVTAVTAAGGSGIGGGSEVVWRVKGSTGGTSGADFFTAGTIGATELKMAAVLLGISGNPEVGEVIGGTTVGTEEVVLRERGEAILGGAAGKGGADTGAGGARGGGKFPVAAGAGASGG